MSNARTSTSATSNDDDLLAEVLTTYLTDLENGTASDPMKLAARYPRIAPRLQTCLANLQFVEQVTGASKQELSLAPEDGSEHILGDFRIIREVGRGGMGVVYDAHQISLGRRVALKTLPFAAVLDPRQLQRFKNEAQAAASLRHPNIVSVHAVGCVRGVHFYAMDFIEGQSLAEIIDELRGLKSPIDEPSRSNVSDVTRTFAYGRELKEKTKSPDGVSADRAVQDRTTIDTDKEPQFGITSKQPIARNFYISVAKLGIQAAEALDYARQTGVVHRDITPSNLLIDTTGHLFVTDFGLATTNTTTNLTITGDLLGTIRYMSPEQASGQRDVLDHRTDIYSLGVTLYELLTLRPAHLSKDRQTLLREVIEQEPRLPRKIDPGIPKDLETLILKAISKDPNHRYQTAGDFAADLRLFVENKPVRARRLGPTGRLVRWVKRKPALSASFAMIGILLLALAIGGPIMALRQRDISRQMGVQNYVLSISAAYQAWEEANIERARELLDSQVSTIGGRDHTRSFEWRYLDTQLKAIEAVTTLQCGREVLSLDFSPDGKYLASAGVGGHVRIWTQRSGIWTETAKLIAHADDTTGVAFSGDSRLLAVSSRDGTVSLWDTSSLGIANVQHTSLEPSQRLPGNGSELLCIAFSPDSRRLAAGGIHDESNPATVTLWDISTGESRALFGHQENIFAVAFSPDGKLLASGSQDSMVRIWNLQTDETEQQLSRPQWVFSVAFSPNGQRLATGGFADLRIFNTDDWTARDAMHAGEKLVTVTSLSYSPDGKMLVSGSHENVVNIWDAVNGRLVARLRGHSSAVTCVKVSADGNWIASGSKDNTIRIYPAPKNLGGQVPSSEMLWRAPVALSDDGRWLAVGNAQWGAITTRHGRETHLYNLVGGTKQLLTDREYVVKALSWCPEDLPFGTGNYLAVGTLPREAESNGRIRFWDLDKSAWLSNRDISIGDFGERFLFSPNETIAAVEWNGREIRFFDVVTGKPCRSLDAEEEIIGHSLAISPDGETLIVGCGRVGHGRWHGGELLCWNLSGDKAQKNKIKGHEDLVYSIAFSPDGQVFASASLDGIIKLWDANAFTMLRSIRAHSQMVHCLAFSPDGKTLASGGYGMAKLWHVETGQILAPLNTYSGVQTLAFSADGKTLVASLADGSVRLWHASLDRANWPSYLH